MISIPAHDRLKAERDAVIACMGLHIYENPKPAIGLPMILTNESMARQDAAWATKRDAALDALIEKAKLVGRLEAARMIEREHGIGDWLVAETGDLIAATGKEVTG